MFVVNFRAFTRFPPQAWLMLCWCLLLLYMVFILLSSQSSPTSFWEPLDTYLWVGFPLKNNTYCIVKLLRDSIAISVE